MERGSLSARPKRVCRRTSSSTSGPDGLPVLTLTNSTRHWRPVASRICSKSADGTAPWQGRLGVESQPPAYRPADIGLVPNQVVPGLGRIASASGVEVTAEERAPSCPAVTPGLAPKVVDRRRVDHT